MKIAAAAALSAFCLLSAAHAATPADRAPLEAARAALASGAAAHPGEMPAADKLARLDHALAQRDWPASGRFVAVNIPEGVVRGVEDGRVVFESKAIVGKRSTKTPTFAASAVSVTFNPTWHPTPSIAAEEKRAGPVRPGPSNPLGHVRVNIPNGDHIYLHSTNKPKLFERTDSHYFSHGCVRVKDAAGLAKWLLGEDAWWAADGDALVETWKERTVKLAEPVPVFIEYRAATVGADGRVAYHGDPYGRLSRP